MAEGVSKGFPFDVRRVAEAGWLPLSRPTRSDPSVGVDGDRITGSRLLGIDTRSEMKDTPIGLCEPDSKSHIDPELFFAQPKTPQAEQAKGVCDRCPMQLRCLTYALRHGVTDGIWGGLTGEERQKIWNGWPKGRPKHFDKTYHRQVMMLQIERRASE